MGVEGPFGSSHRRRHGPLKTREPSSCWSPRTRRTLGPRYFPEKKSVSEAFADVRVAAEVRAAHSAGLIEMSKGPFQSFTTELQQAQAARTANAVTIAVHCVAGRWVLLRVAPAPIGSEM
jgi:hypothetical protein